MTTQAHRKTSKAPRKASKAPRKASKAPRKASNAARKASKPPRKASKAPGKPSKATGEAPRAPRKASSSTGKAPSYDASAPGKRILVHVGIRRDPGWLYFINSSFDVARIPVSPSEDAGEVMRRLMLGDPALSMKIATVFETRLTAGDRKPGMLYSLTETCDICEESQIEALARTIAESSRKSGRA